MRRTIKLDDDLYGMSNKISEPSTKFAVVSFIVPPFFCLPMKKKNAKNSSK